MTVEELRTRIRDIEGQSVQSTRWQTGIEGLDTLLGGLPLPGILELTSRPGEGGYRVASSVAAALTQAGQWVAWLDGDRELYPPGLRLQGVELTRLTMVRPVGDRGAWAAEVLVSSGCFPWVVVTGNVPLGGGERVGREPLRRGIVVCVSFSHILSVGCPLRCVYRFRIR